MCVGESLHKCTYTAYVHYTEESDPLELKLEAVGATL